MTAHIEKVDILCSVCRKKVMAGIFASPITSVSLPYCHECFGIREPYWLLISFFASLVDTVEDLRPETSYLLPGAQRLISNSLEVAGKTRDQFYKDVLKEVQYLFDSDDSII